MPGFRPCTPDEEELIAISQQFGDAEVSHDAGVLERLLDDNFILVTGNQPTMVGKAAFLELACTFKFTSLTSDYEHVRIDGDTAIVVSTVTTRLPTGEKGGPYRITIIYVKRRGKWRALAEQIGVIARSGPKEDAPHVRS
jgi:hypothetical protein